MAHFAEIDSNNIVLRVLVVADEQENRGQEFLADELGLGGRWVQTSYHNNIRNMFAGPGYVYNEELDIFLPPKPYPSWVLNTELLGWEAPIPRPEIPDKVIGWDETNQLWDITDPIPFS